MPELTTDRNKNGLKLLVSLRQSLDLKKVQTSLVKLLGPLNIFLIPEERCLDMQNIERDVCKFAHSDSRIKELCSQTLETAKIKAKKSMKIELFSCLKRFHGFCYPLKDENVVFAYLVGCGMARKPNKSQLDFLDYYTETLINGLKKEIQLDELYKTIQPRATALSTVHTIHRLMSSSLSLNELLVRIARLSLQLIKANRCSIKLVDSKKKTLLPKATVDLRTKKTRLKKVKIGRWAPGKAVKYGKSILGEKYLATPLVDEDIIGVITLYDKIDGLGFDNFDLEIMRTLAEQAAIAIKNTQLYREQERLTMGSIKTLAQIIKNRGLGICMPSNSFLKIVHFMGQEFGMSPHDLKLLQYASLLHDAGELMIPERVLRKKGKLTEGEYTLIKEHPLKGASIIKSLRSLNPITPIIMHHHENYDGKGYPKGLKGSEIPLGARILAVASAFCAMVTKRPYRMSLSVKRAVEEIKKNSGKQFDPKVVEAFLKAMKRKDVSRLIQQELYEAP